MSLTTADVARPTVLRQRRDKAIGTEGTRVQDVQAGLNASNSDLHFHTSLQSESGLSLAPFLFSACSDYSAILSLSFPRFRLNVLLTLFLPLSLRDGLSHLKLNTRPGATPKQPSVRPCLTLSFFFSIVSREREKKNQ